MPLNKETKPKQIVLNTWNRANCDYHHLLFKGGGILVTVGSYKVMKSNYHLHTHLMIDFHNMKLTVMQKNL